MFDKDIIKGKNTYKNCFYCGEKKMGETLTSIVKPFISIISESYSVTIRRWRKMGVSVILILGSKLKHSLHMFYLFQRSKSLVEDIRRDVKDCKCKSALKIMRPYENMEIYFQN